MKNAILVPGRPDKDEYYDSKYPTNSNSHWFPWLSKQLQIKDVFANVKADCKTNPGVLDLEDGTTFRNQGDCVSFFATGETNPATNGASDERANNKKNN